jgi:hypothetical protein
MTNDLFISSSIALRALYDMLFRFLSSLRHVVCALYDIPSKLSHCVRTERLLYKISQRLFESKRSGSEIVLSSATSGWKLGFQVNGGSGTYSIRVRYSKRCSHGKNQ